ncbi:MAG: 3D-(3,5/4)-trihydroxycyclohexane-1,2-dione acylhydrolase (decyclizing) [Hyphomicrobiales bacterium]|nr:MAG: 3D-(3,5/4)-trihydroxycyclohexane-1,2-dione acylhydrolase (decyclizing) [Hyphomicrobiales bacterium]
MGTVRLTAAQAMIRYLSMQFNEDGDRFISGFWAIFGHGNVAGLGEALFANQDVMPTWRGHNEQGMAHAAIAYSKTLNRNRAMAVTSSIGPGATNMVTAAALAHVNRLPVLFVPGDVFASRAPDPVLQQIENFEDGTISANDCFKPVSRYFDRIMRPEQLLTALPRAMATMIDPVTCGPVTLAFCQDVQAEAFDWPEQFFEKKVWRKRLVQPDPFELTQAVELIREANSPLIISGGGILYANACGALDIFVKQTGIPVVETQAGKSSMPWDHEYNFGSIGVTGATSANKLAKEADLVIAIGTRLQDFTTGSRTLFQNPDCKILSINVTPYDSEKHSAFSLVSDARIAIEALQPLLAGLSARKIDPQLKSRWMDVVSKVTAPPAENKLPSDSQVIGAVQRTSDEDTIVLCAAGGLPGELHKLWKASRPNSYHVEYGFSCMGYEIAGGLGAKMAAPDREIVVMVGDGSYMMLNSELATSVMLGLKIILVILDNRGFGCINRLQMATGSASFNNLLDTARHAVPSNIDFVAHAGAMGATAEKVASISDLEKAMFRARESSISYVIVIDTDPMPSTQEGGHWWEVAVPEVSARTSVVNAHNVSSTQKQYQRTAD